MSTDSNVVSFKDANGAQHWAAVDSPAAESAVRAPKPVKVTKPKPDEKPDK